MWAFFEWEAHLIAQGREPLVRPSIFRYREMNAGLTMFFVQYLVQAGVFFTIPLFLSVALGLSALETGVRILPLSIALLAGAVGIPRFFPRASPRLVVRLGLLGMLAGTVVLAVALEPDAEASIVTVPLLLLGLGMGALASQLGAVTVSAVPERLTGEVGGIQNTATNLGAAIGTALAGIDHDRRPHGVLPDERHGEPEHPVVGQRPGQCPARVRDSFHVRRGPQSCAR